MLVTRVGAGGGIKMTTMTSKPSDCQIKPVKCCQNKDVESGSRWQNSF